MPYNIESKDNNSNEQAQALPKILDHASLNEKNADLLQCLGVMLEYRSNQSDIKRCVITGFLDNITLSDEKLDITLMSSLTFNRQD